MWLAQITLFKLSIGFQPASLAQVKNAQQSVQRICGSLRGLQAFFWLRVFPAPKQNPRPPTCG